MINKAEPILVGQIFGLDTKNTYSIPMYQRKYSWSAKQWEELFSDVLGSEEGQFLGAIIVIRDEKSGMGNANFEITDGQQRLTTISLLYTSILNKINKVLKVNDNLTPVERDDLEEQKDNILRRLLLRPKLEISRDNIRLVPSKDGNNIEDYLYLLDKEIAPNDQSISKPKNFGNRKFGKASKYFLNLLDEAYPEGSSSKGLISYIEKLNQSTLVSIIVSSHSNAFVLFESLNNRGMPLTPFDIIKNKFLAEADKSERDIDKMFRKWTQLSELLEDDNVTQIRFLRQLYNIFQYDEFVHKKGITRATKSNIIDIYSKLFSKDPEKTIELLLKKAGHYTIFLNQESEDNDEVKRQILRLTRVGAAPFYGFYLYLIEREVNEGNLVDILQYFVNYFVRRNLTDFPNTSTLDSLFISLVKHFEENKTLPIGKESIAHYIKEEGLIADDEKLLTALNSDIYDTNHEMARYILCHIEEENQTKENKVDLWQKDKGNKYIFTIEHILPKTNNVTKDWVNDLTEGDTQKAKEIVDEFSHKIGNLTLSAYNSNLATMSFMKKRDRKKGTKYIGFKNGLYLNESISIKDKWNEEDIQERTKDLIDAVKNYFSL